MANSKYDFAFDIILVHEKAFAKSQTSTKLL